MRWAAVYILLSSLIAVSLGNWECSLWAAPSLPSWLQELRPEARFRLRWLERNESNQDASEPQLLASAGLFPHFAEYSQAGVEISTGSTAVGESPNSITLGNAQSSKAVVLNQVFVGFNAGHRYEWIALLGKFSSPLFYSPLMWDSDNHPEGLIQSFSMKFFSDALRVALFAGQFSIDQVGASISAGTPIRRSWLFEEGALIVYSPEADLQFRFACNSYFYHDPSERVANVSAHRGNNFLGTIDASTHFQYDYAPIEWVAQAQARPLGILAGVQAAMAINFRTPDNQRSYYIDAYVGDAWKKRNVLFDLSYYYAEPDTTIALMADDEWGSANRNGGRGRLSYFLMDFMRIGSSFLFVETLANSAYQSTRKEGMIDLEMQF